MPNLIKRILHLTGPRAGQTCKLGKQFQFTNGKIVLHGSQGDVERLTHWLAINYAAYPVGHPKLEAGDGERTDPETTVEGATTEVLSDVQPDGEGTAPSETLDGSPTDEAAPDSAPDLPAGDGHGDTRVHRIEEALTALDVTNDEHWIEGGKPAVQAVSTLMNEQVSRADIDAVAPDFIR